MPARAVSSGAPNTRLKFGSRSLFKFSVKNVCFSVNLKFPFAFSVVKTKTAVQGALGGIKFVIYARVLS